MSEGLMTALAVFGLILLLEILDVIGAARRAIRGGASASEQDQRIEALEARITALEQRAGPASS